MRKKEGAKIDLAHYSLGDEYIVTLSKTLESLPTFNTVNLCDNRLTDRGLHAIITTIVEKPGCRGITNLNLSENKVDGDSVQIMATYLKSKECQLRVLTLAKADLDDEEAKIFGECGTAERAPASVSPTLTKLTPRCCTPWPPSLSCYSS